MDNRKRKSGEAGEACRGPAISAGSGLALVGPDATIENMELTVLTALSGNVVKEAEESMPAASSWRSVAAELGQDANLDEANLSAAFLDVLQAAEKDAARFQKAFIHASRQTARLEREAALLHEAGVKLRYERAELLVERSRLREQLLAATVKRRNQRLAEIERQRNNNATWLRRVWTWIGLQLGATP